MSAAFIAVWGVVIAIALWAIAQGLAIFSIDARTLDYKLGLLRWAQVATGLSGVVASIAAVAFLIAVLK